MLSPDSYETLPEEISRLLLTLESATIADICRRIAKMRKISASSEYQLLRLSEIRQFEIDLKVALATTTSLTLAEIDKMYERAAEEAYVYDKRLFEAKGVPMTPYKENVWLWRITEAAGKQTRDSFENLTRTVGFTARDGKFLSPRELFSRKLSEFEFQVAAGTITYDQAIKRTVKELVDSGLKTVEYPYAGSRSLEASVRANILTGLSNLSGEIAWKNIEDLGVEIVETSAHLTARPDHQKWQGRRFALNGAAAEIRAKAEVIRETDKGVTAMRKAEAAARKEAFTGV